MAIISELNDFATFNYETLYPGNAFFDYFANPKVPFLAVFLYLTLSKPVFGTIRDVFKIDPKGSAIKWFTVLHSGFLAIYSGWTFFNVAQILYKYQSEHGGMWATLCGDRQSLWVDANMSFWITHFYISKYYEFVDSWIIVLKGRDPIFLQTYHHAGVVLIMWALTVTHSSPVIVLVFLNSFIHTLMYTYYTAAALGYHSPLKHYLTQMQLLQFIVGIGVTVPTHFIKDSIGEPVLNRAQAFSLLCLQVYTIILIGLFGQFYYQSYVVSKNKKRKD